MFGRLGGGVVGSGLEDDLLAGERLALASQLASSPLAGDGAFVVVDPEVVIGPGGVAQQVPDDGKYRVADGDNRNLSTLLGQFVQGFIVFVGSGLLIHTVAGSAGGSGCLWTNRSGWVV